MDRGAEDSGAAEAHILPALLRIPCSGRQHQHAQQHRLLHSSFLPLHVLGQPAPLPKPTHTSHRDEHLPLSLPSLYPPAAPRGGPARKKAGDSNASPARPAVSTLESLLRRSCRRRPPAPVRPVHHRRRHGRACGIASNFVFWSAVSSALISACSRRCASPSSWCACPGPAPSSGPAMLLRLGGIDRHDLRLLVVGQRHCLVQVRNLHVRASSACRPPPPPPCAIIGTVHSAALHNATAPARMAYLRIIVIFICVISSVDTGIDSPADKSTATDERSANFV